MSEPGPVTFSTELRVRYSETDQMGVVYHAHYLVWCEVARSDFMRRHPDAECNSRRRAHCG